jgi:urea carboxylase
VPIWSTHRQGASFEPGVPWLLRFFDRIRWYPVTPEKLLELRAEMVAGHLDLQIEDGEFSMRDYDRFLADNEESIAAFKRGQGAAFDEERDAWEASGEFDRTEKDHAPAAEATKVHIPPGYEGVEAPFNANVFRIDIAQGEMVTEGQVLVSLEAMKMEVHVLAPAAGRVAEVVVREGDSVAPGSVLVVLKREVAA